MSNKINNVNKEVVGSVVGVIVRRLLADSPKELKIVRNIAGGVAIVGGVMMCFTMPPALAVALPIVVSIAGGIAAGTQLGEKGE